MAPPEVSRINVSNIRLDAGDEQRERAKRQTTVDLCAASAVKQNNKWNRELERRFSDSRTVVLRSVMIGSIPPTQGSTGPPQEAWIQVESNGSCVYMKKHPGQSVEDLEQVDRRTVVMGGIAFDDQSVEEMAKRVRQEIDGIREAVRRKKINEQEAELIFASLACRRAGVKLAKLLGLNKNPLTKVEGCISLADLAAAKMYSLALSEKNNHEPESSRVIYALVAELLSVSWPMLPDWFRKEPAYMDIYLRLAYDSAFHQASPHESKMKLNLPNLAAHAQAPSWFTREKFSLHPLDREKIVINGRQGLRILANASAISPAFVLDKSKHLLQGEIESPMNYPDSAVPSPDRTVAITAASPSVGHAGIGYVRYGLTFNYWRDYFLPGGGDSFVPNSPFDMSLLRETNIPGGSGARRGAIRRLKEALADLASFSDWELVRVVWQDGVLRAANEGNMLLVDQFVKALMVMTAGHFPDMMDRPDRYVMTDDLKTFMGLDD